MMNETMVNETTVCPIDKVEYSGEPGTIELSLESSFDYSTSVSLTIGEYSAPFALIPDTGVSQVIFMQKDCAGCYYIGGDLRYESQCPSTYPE